MTLDSVLNVLVPVIIFGLLGVLIYSKAKKPIDKFFAMIRDWIQGINQEQEIESSDGEYRIEYRGAEW